MKVRRLAGVLVVLFAVAAAVLPVPASVVESWYSRGIYPAIQSRLTPASNTVPIALLDVVIGCVAIGGIFSVVRRWRADGFIRAARATLWHLIVLAASVYLLFLALWGLNYRRIPIEQKIDYVESRVTPDAVRQLAETAVQQINRFYADAHRVDAPGAELAQAFTSAQRRLGLTRFATPGRPKRSFLELYFRKAAIDGMTDPLFLEIILNRDVLPVERPFVLAHEWGHLAGFADESEANLVAWLSCLEGNALARYSGWLALYGPVMEAISIADRRRIDEQLASGPQEDLAAIRARLARSAPAMRAVARDTYDAYLKANRVKEGIANYDAVVRLILGAGAENGWAPRATAR